VNVNIAQNLPPNVKRALDEQRAWREALALVKVGMTDGELERLHPGLVFGGEQREVRGAGRVEIWRTFRDDHTTLYLVNGRVAVIVR
jgi:hypothetical protein